MIGIMSAMQEEIQALLDHLQQVQTSQKGNRTYYKGLLFNTEVVLVFSRWGKIAAAVTATQLINDFEVDELIFTGVAGAIQPHLNIGDIIIAKNLIQHDVDATPFFKKYTVPIIDKMYFETDLTQRAKLLKAAQHFLENYSKIISNEEAALYTIKEPKVLIADIASGDEFINTTAKVSIINKELPTVNAVEMEGAAVAQVCYEYDIPFSVIRIISDKAHDNAHIEFQKFANAIATKYALGIFNAYLN
tara:strand:+ start:595289 stop:596029 length:741 start_codon:yes stop_codon:yes gene_type:complete